MCRRIGTQILICVHVGVRARERDRVSTHIIKFLVSLFFLSKSLNIFFIWDYGIIILIFSHAELALEHNTEGVAGRGRERTRSAHITPSNGIIRKLLHNDLLGREKEVRGGRLALPYEGCVAEVRRPRGEGHCGIVLPLI